jgi:hypothetical protein
VKPPCSRRSSQPAASACQERGQVANATSIAIRRLPPTLPAQPCSCATAGEEAKGKLTAPRVPASATKARESATSIASGFSQKTLLPAASAARA